MARRRERAQRDRRLEKLAIEVLTATGEREATIAATEQGAGDALQAMITDESLTVSEAVQWVRRSYQSSGSDPASPSNRRHTTAGVTRLGCSCVEVVHDAEDPSAVRSGRGLFAGSRRRQTQFSAKSASRSDLDSPHRDHFPL